MRLQHSHRWLSAFITLCSMLFMQLAVSAYTCPLPISSMEEVAQMRLSMPDCTGMDAEQPALCAAFAHPGQPSLDKPDLPSISPFIPSALSATILPAIPDAAGNLPPADNRLLARATAPPMAIQHCCFRI